MKPATLAIALIAAVTTLPGCLTLGDTNEVYPPTVGRELTDLRMSAERGALSPQEYEHKKAQILAGQRNGQSRGGGQAAPADPFGDPNMGMAQAPAEPQWQQGYGQPPEGMIQQMGGQMPMGQQMPMSPQDMQMQQQQQPQYSPQQMQEMFQQQQMQAPQAQQMPAEGWH
jgi:hypothetical protein